MVGRIGSTRFLGFILVCVVVCHAPLQGSFNPDFQQDNPSQPGQSSKSVDLNASPSGREFTEAKQLFVRGDLDAAQQSYRRALELAQQEQNLYVEASSRMGLGLILMRKAQFPGARAELGKALALFKANSNRLYAGKTLVSLGTVAWHMGDLNLAESLYQEALAEFEAIGDLREKANVLYNLLFTAPRSESREERIQRALTAAGQAGDPRLEGQILHTWGDIEYGRGDYSTSLEKYEQALALLQAVNAKGETARVYTSLGRLQRVHGSPDRALQYYSLALKIQEEIADQQGVIQSINAIALACDLLGRRKEALEYFERALVQARRTGSPALIGRQLSNLGEAYSLRGNYGSAIKFFQEALQYQGDAGYTYSFLSYVQNRNGDYSQALDTAQRAVELSESGIREFLPIAFLRRAQAREKLGQSTEALADVRAALREIEQMRGHLVPDDFMKAGFADKQEEFFAYAIHLLEQSQNPLEAMEVAEQARARALIDLLETRAAAPNSSFHADLGSARKLESDLRARGMNPAHDPATPSSEIAMRGGDPESTSLLKKWQGIDPGLRSLVSAAPIHAGDIRTIVARHHTTLVSYWVNPDATFAWVLTPEGSVHTARSDISRDRLARLIKRTIATVGSPVERGGPSEKDSEGGSPPQEIIAGWEPRMRGERLLVLGSEEKKAWRELDQILIQPIRRWLPARPGAMLTIVPHGPLFLLSFAALLDENGRYLVERYTLHYTPSAAALQLCEKKKLGLAGRSPSYLLIADPSDLPAQPTGKPLPSLPGSRKEIEAIGRLLSPRSVTTLVGAEAQEERVCSASSDKTIIHIATHGIVRNESPLDSFLALGRGQSTGSQTTLHSQDGRLTVQEIYDLHLRADLVVLSACRTASGKISGDGLTGLTRAFFYAGTPSVIATLWDIADEPGQWLLPAFYRSMQRLKDKGKALRTAQLQLLDALRRGQVKITTPTATYILPEHPAFWAGFILLGEP